MASPKSDQDSVALSITLATAIELQEILTVAAVPSVVTGVFGLNYHGVDIVLHDVELCIPDTHIDTATELMAGCTDLYRRLPDCTESDLYHIYRKNSKRFLLRPGNYYEIYLVADSALRIGIEPSTVETGLTSATAHIELQEFHENVPDSLLSRISWPTLSAFLNGWLTLAGENHDNELQYIFLMYAERLVDANASITLDWIDKEIKGAKAREMGKKLVKTRALREEQMRAFYDM